jgi:hypothetical protein
MHDNLGAFWSPFMVRWQHGRAGVPVAILYQALSILLVLGCVLSVIVDFSQASWVTLIGISLSVSAYVLYKRLFQLTYTHFITSDELRRAIRMALTFGLAELIVILLALAVLSGPVPAYFRFGLVGIFGVVVTGWLITHAHLAPTPDQIRPRLRALSGEVFANAPLLLHNVLLVSYFYLLKVPVPQRAGGTPQEQAGILFCVAMSQTFSGVLYSFTEFVRPQTFRWARREGDFPRREFVRLLGLFLLATGGFATVGYVAVRAVSQDRLQDGMFSVWLLCSAGALLLGFCYVFDVVLIATQRYTLLAGCTSTAGLISLLAFLLFPSSPFSLIIVFPAAQLGLLLLAIRSGAHGVRESEAHD